MRMRKHLAWSDAERVAFWLNVQAEANDWPWRYRVVYDPRYDWCIDRYRQFRRQGEG